MRGPVIASLVLLLWGLGNPGVTAGQEVLAGLDFWETDQAQSVEDLSNLGAMCPGCQVIGNPVISLRGIPLEQSPACPGANLGDTDTIVRRPQNTPPLSPGQSAQVEIQVVALHLESVQPFQVDCQGDIQLWVLDVSLPPQNQPPGQLQIHKTHSNGGTFETTLPVRPQFTFTRVDIDPPEVMCAPQPPDHIYVGQGPWVHDPAGAPVLEIPGCTTNFFPGISEPSPLTTTIVGFGVGAPQGFLYFFPTPATTTAAPDPGPGASAPRVLLPNAPNPFTGTTTLGYVIDRPAAVRLTIFNAAGRVVRTLVAGPVAAGRHYVIWDGRDVEGRDVGSGFYSCEVRVGSVRDVRKITLLR